MSTLTVNNLEFEVRRSEKRRALEILVERDGGLVLHAPPHVSDAKLRDFAHRKRMWVYKQMARREALGRDWAPRKVFIEGEGFSYLGRSYRLRLVPQSDMPIKLLGGRFVMPKSVLQEGREHLIRWYVERARVWLTEVVAGYAARMEVLPSGVRVQDLGYRWASCTKRGDLHFHWKCLMAPLTIIDYIIVHELCHMRHRDHSDAFWNEVDKVLPDYRTKKDWLRERGAELDL